ncbi:MAG: MBL fold metallo-hydrolase [Clostridium fessum]
MTVIDVSGCGSGAVFLIKGKANLLFEAGMAYAADQMVENIKRELGDAELDAVLLSHSHYDHVAGLPAVRKAWPGVKTYASERAKEILVKPGALKTIRRLSGEAAEAAGFHGIRNMTMQIYRLMYRWRTARRSNWATIRSTRLRRSATRNVPCLT